MSFKIQNQISVSFALIVLFALIAYCNDCLVLSAHIRNVVCVSASRHSFVHKVIPLVMSVF